MGQKSEFDDDGFIANFFRRDEEVSMPPSMSRLLMVVGGFAVLAAVVAITWATWPKGGSGMDEGSVPVIQADKEPYKVKPEEPGGMDVPNKDSTIFETLKAAQSGEGQVENLLEDSETPVSRDELTEADPDVDATPQADIQIATKGDSETVKEEPVKEATPAPATVKKDAKSVIATLKNEVAPKTSATSGSAYVQLAAVKSDADAKAKWKSLQSKYASLAGLSLRVQKAEVAGKGTFYRVQGGPLSADDAKAVCVKIKAAKGDCLVAK
ncbi:MAG: SPOR domain-containing protein [Pseudobdellovibrionaceae bacterium]